MTQGLSLILFTLFIFLLLILDLKVFHRHPHAIKVREALFLTAFWVFLGLAFGAGVYWRMGHDAALNYVTGYLLEKALSVDNIFVFILVFSYFRVMPRYQHEVLFWGIVGACFFRAVFILAGVTLLHKFHWVIYVFGAFLVFTGFKLAFEKDKEVHPERNGALRLFRRRLGWRDS